jgi:hypothetical protein
MIAIVTHRPTAGFIIAPFSVQWLRARSLFVERSRRDYKEIKTAANAAEKRQQSGELIDAVELGSAM